MADNSAHGSAPSHGFEAHRATYEAFLKGSVALTILCIYTLVALVAFRFGSSLNVLIGFAGLIVGVVTVLIDIKTGGQRWFLSGGALVLFGLLVGMSVS